MPNRWTFKIKPIAELISRYVEGDWIDPFAGYNSPATITNDINPDTPAMYHMKSPDFVNHVVNIIRPESLNGCLFDPPYSLRQLKECYQSHGTDISYNDTVKFYSDMKNKISNLIKPGGHCISFGWNSTGFGKSRGFEIVEILLVPHGGNRYDTIVTVEKKVQEIRDD